MKKLTLSLIVACAVLSPALRAQRGGMPGGPPGFHPAPPFGHPGNGRLPMRGVRSERFNTVSAGFARWGWGFPAYYSDQAFGQTCNEASQPPQVLVIGPQPPPPLQTPPPPPEPARLVTHEYDWPAAAESGASHFALAWKDGSVRFAIAVWAQDGMLHYTQTDGTAGRAPLHSIDREATRRLNAENRQSLSLPPVAPLE